MAAGSAQLQQGHRCEQELRLQRELQGLWCFRPRAGANLQPGSRGTCPCAGQEMGPHLPLKPQALATAGDKIPTGMAVLPLGGTRE